MKLKRKPRPSSRDISVETDDARPFPIVGLGASAGGLEALEQFLLQVPPNSGMAFVLVQHLDPNHVGIMPELLQRHTAMKVVQVQNRTTVQPDCVYVIPPNKDMSLLKGVLHLFAPAEPRGRRLPIDFFLRSLALDRGDRSIGVILSGMGSDGTLGLRAIKEAAGLVLVQDPASAKFDGMPRSAIDAGLADIVAPVEALPDKILAHFKHRPLIARSDIQADDKRQGAIDKAVIPLRAHTGHDFSLYKRNTLHRRIERRMGIHQILKPSAYVRYLQDNPQELELLFKELLIGVTNFFRDAESWEHLKSQAFPALLANRSAGQALRAWVTGCSTGEEAYSLAMVFKEAVDLAGNRGNCSLQIFATDLDRDAIDRARQGLFLENIAADVSPERLKRFFTQEERGYRVRKEIREMVIFAPQNLIMDPPFTRLDILCCRNLLIYLAQEVQRKLIPVFHYSLNPGGILFLGSAETIGNASDLFLPLAGTSRLYRRPPSRLPSEAVVFPTSFCPSPSKTGTHPTSNPLPSLQAIADQLILRRYSHPAVLVGAKGDILYVHGRTGKYLEPASGKANWNLFAMARDGLRHPLAEGFRKALLQSKRVVLPSLRIESGEPDQRVDVTLERIEEAGQLQGLVMIVFTDVSTPPPQPKTVHKGSNAGAHGSRLPELERELELVRAESRTLQGEMQTSQEELRSANEELQSTNEELQSANEELTTSKEEMQSLNEELQTLNAELQAKVDDLSRTSDDMKNLLDSTDIATLFLDRDLLVRRFTPRTTHFIKLIPGDVGRPITDLVLDLDYFTLADDVRGVLKSLTSTERVVAAGNHRWFNIRIMPYRTMDDRIDGVVITFADITGAKTLEIQLRAQQAELEKRFEGHVPDSPPPNTRPKKAVSHSSAGKRTHKPNPVRRTE